MLYSKNLLSRYITCTEDVETIAQTLTLKTCEVEETHTRIIPDLVVIGKVLSTVKHPNADTLTICQLDCGSRGQYQICTGADNVLVDSYVAVALPDCFLPAINLKIEPRTMRGEASNGMICSKNELGIAEDVDEHRIRTLQSNHGMKHHLGNRSNGHVGDFDDITDKDLGVSLAHKYPWLETWIIDVENKAITHRPDLFGHFGLAVESHALFADSLTFQTVSSLMEKTRPGVILEVLNHATVAQRNIQVQTPHLLSYTLLEVNTITVKPSDFYTRLLLIDMGLQPRNNRVDFSNIFMLLSGQPVHFFDAKKVAGDIIVRQASHGERFTDLFGKEHHLLESDMVIADHEKILALAGIVGSSTSGVDETTTDIIVEIANFDAVTVRKTGTRLGLRTDAELRYEKYINPLFSLFCLRLLLDELNYAAPNMGQYTVGGVQRRVNEQNTTSLLPRISVDRDRITTFVHGAKITKTDSDAFIAESKKLLHRIGLVLHPDNSIEIPGRRSPDDLTCEEDIIEEIVRLYGFDRLSTEIYTDVNQYIPFGMHVRQQRTLEDLLQKEFHYDQLETYPRLHQRRIETFGLSTDLHYSMKNPLTPEQKTMRSTLLRSLIEIAEKNGPFFDTFRVFDIGKTRDKRRDVHEHSTLGCATRTKEPQTHIDHPLLTAKGSIAAMLRTHGIYEQPTYEATSYEYFHPKQQGAVIVQGKVIGHVGSIHPSVLEYCKLPEAGQLVITELDLTELLAIEATTDKKPIYESLQDQIIRRDLSFVIDAESPYGAVADAITHLSAISEVEVFDLYQGVGLPENKKSISLRLKIKGDGTLTTEAINEIMKTAIMQAEQTGAVLRG